MLAISGSMSASTNLQSLQRKINELRVETSDVKKFVPEAELYNVMSRATISKVVDEFVPFYHTEEVVEFITKDAPKTFSILVLINQVKYINYLIRDDQLQSRCIDNLLPFSKARLKEILGDDYVAEMFYEKQWEFTVPVFSGRIIPRTLERQAILPYLRDTPLASGGFSSVYLLDIHPSHRPKGYDSAALVSRSFM